MQNKAEKEIRIRTCVATGGEIFPRPKRDSSWINRNDWDVRNRSKNKKLHQSYLLLARSVQPVERETYVDRIIFLPKKLSKIYFYSEFQERMRVGHRDRRRSGRLQPKIKKPYHDK